MAEESSFGFGFFLVVFYCRMQSVGCQIRTVHLNGWEPSKGFGNTRAANCQCFLNSFPLSQLRCHTARCNGCAATKSLEFNVLYAIVINFYVHCHEVSTNGVSNRADAIWVRDFSHIAWILKMVHYFVRI